MYVGLNVVFTNRVFCVCYVCDKPFGSRECMCCLCSSSSSGGFSGLQCYGFFLREVSVNSSNMNRHLCKYGISICG